jgi:pyruvate/2-oxoglutarate dehydrogenase complex dihydrolipoamide acyltransferase (E2) component
VPKLGAESLAGTRGYQEVTKWHGIHKKRAVEDPKNPGQVAIRPMMYLALSYDHRIIDGAEAVGFLIHIKDMIEKPERLLLA